MTTPVVAAPDTTPNLASHFMTGRSKNGEKAKGRSGEEGTRGGKAAEPLFAYAPLRLFAPFS